MNDPSQKSAAAPSEPISPSSRSALLIVFLVVFIDLLGFGIVLPMLPRVADTYVAQYLGLAESTRAVEPARENSTAGAILGLLMASFSLMQFLFAPSWGRLSDRVGRRPVLLIGLAGSVAFYALFGYAASLSAATSAAFALALMFVSRMGAGVAGATIATAQAVIADCTPPEKRKHGMALIGAAFGIGFTFGPLLGALSLRLFDNKLESIGYVASVLSLIALVLGVWLMPETRRPGEAPTARRQIFDFAAWRMVLGNRALAPTVLVFFLATFGFAGFEVTLSLLLRDRFAVEERDIFLYFAYIGFVLMLTQGYFYRKAAKKLMEPTLMTIGIAFMGLGVGVLAVLTGMGTDSSWLLITGLTAAVVGFAFLTPSAQALVSRRTDPERQGEVLGVNQSASSLARIVAPPTFLVLYKATPTHLLPYAVGAAVLLLMLPVMPKIRRG
jgi:MFS family permease